MTVARLDDWQGCCLGCKEDVIDVDERMGQLWLVSKVSSSSTVVTRPVDQPNDV